MRKTISFAAALVLALSAANASFAAAPCRDTTKGKFIKCPASAPAKPVKCKDAKGKFAKCSAPGAKPVT